MLRTIRQCILQLAVASFALMSCCGQNTVVYVDFGPSGQSYRTTSPDSFGNFWNNATEVATGISNLVDRFGNQTEISLACSGSIAANPGGTTSPDPTTLGGMAVPSATKDWFYIQAGQTLTITLSNLPVTGVYRLSCFGSRDVSQTRITRYEVEGLTTSAKLLTTSGVGIGALPEPSANRSGLTVFDNISPSGNGKIVVNVRREAGDFGYLGALRLEGANATNLPPVATALSIAGAPREGAGLIGQYTYLDSESNPELGSSIFWQSASSPSSPPQLVSSGASALTYSPTADGVGRYFRMGVIPRAGVGNPEGLPAYSPWVGPVVSSNTLTSFHVGSSFTAYPNIPQQIRNLGAASGRPFLPGVQLSPGKDSKFHWENGLPGGAFSFGTPSRSELETATWDILVLQPYNSEWFPESASQMREYAQRYYTLADSKGAQVYLYDYWPWLSKPLSAQADINAVFENVRSSISVGGSKPALIIPAGPCLKAVIDACGTGALAGYSRNSFYRDDLHTNDLGSYVSALAHYATIFKKSPIGLPATTLDSSPDTDNPVGLPAAVATRIQQIVWNTVGTYPNSGVVIVLEPPPPPPPPPVYVTHAAVTVPEVVAFAFGPSTDGLTAPAENLPHAVDSLQLNKLGLEYTINPDAEAQQVTFTPEWSSDLVHWTATQPAGFAQTRNGQKFTLTWNRVQGSQFVRIYVVKPGS